MLNKINDIFSAIGRFLLSCIFFIRKFLFSFIGSDETGEIQPVYVWVTILMILLIITWFGRLFSPTWGTKITDTMFVALLAYIAIWLKLYNDDRKNNLK